MQINFEAQPTMLSTFVQSFTYTRGKEYQKVFIVVVANEHDRALIFFSENEGEKQTNLLVSWVRSTFRNRWLKKITRILYFYNIIILNYSLISNIYGRFCFATNLGTNL